MLNDKIDLHKTFSLMTFEAGDEKICRDYMNTRGLYLYKQVYDAMVKWIPDVQEIKYRQFASFIRYDKSIRDKLYIYLAAAEEYLRNIIFDELEIDCLPEDTTNKKLEIDALRVRTEEEQYDKSNLYYYSYAKNFDFGLLKRIFEKFNLAQKYNLAQTDLTGVHALRNKVMHHNMLLLSCFTERQDIEKNISEIESGIESLYRILPTEELRDGSVVDGKVFGGLTQAINKSNYPNGDVTQEPYNTFICLHRFANGGFIR